MEIKEIQNKKVEIITDIICDSCGQSCKVREDIIDNDLRLDHVQPSYSFEFMDLEAHWGYDSGKDCESWSAQICEKCVDEKLSFIKFKKKEY
jgi:hypothetical protein